MSEFEELYAKKIYLTDDAGAVEGPFPCIFNQADGKIVIPREQVPFRLPFKAYKLLPNGDREFYEVKDLMHEPSFHDIPARVVLLVQKEGKAFASPAVSLSNVTINNSPGALVGVGNTQNLSQHFLEIGTVIQNSNLPPEKKREALEKLKEFLAHPAVVEAIGVVTSTALDRLWPR
jgi:hypothetical protein